MTNEQSATLLRLNKQAQVAALNAVGFSDITENSRASEFGQRIKWAAGLLDYQTRASYPCAWTLLRNFRPGVL